MSHLQGKEKEIDIDLYVIMFWRITLDLVCFIYVKSVFQVIITILSYNINVIFFHIKIVEVILKRMPMFEKISKRDQIYEKTALFGTYSLFD
jgi:hypothetical protein